MKKIMIVLALMASTGLMSQTFDFSCAPAQSLTFPGWEIEDGIIEVPAGSWLDIHIEGFEDNKKIWFRHAVNGLDYGPWSAIPASLLRDPLTEESTTEFNADGNIQMLMLNYAEAFRIQIAVGLYNDDLTFNGIMSSIIFKNP